MTQTPNTSFYRKGAPLMALVLALSITGCTTERQIAAICRTNR